MSAYILFSTGLNLFLSNDQIVTPDLKMPSFKKEGSIIFVDLSNGNSRIGGTALAQVFMQLGNEAPDVNNASLLKNAFNATQSLLKGMIQF